MEHDIFRTCRSNVWKGAHTHISSTLGLGSWRLSGICTRVAEDCVQSWSRFGLLGSSLQHVKASATTTKVQASKRALNLISRQCVMPAFWDTGMLKATCWLLHMMVGLQWQPRICIWTLNLETPSNPYLEFAQAHDTQREVASWGSVCLHSRAHRCCSLRCSSTRQGTSQLFAGWCFGEM